jgi:hypothetical protein
LYFLLLAIRGSTFKFVLLLADVESVVLPYRIVDGEITVFAFCFSGSLVSVRPGHLSVGDMSSSFDEQPVKTVSPDVISKDCIGIGGR